MQIRGEIRILRLISYAQTSQEKNAGNPYMKM